MASKEHPLKQRIRDCKSLPTLPGVAVELLQHCRAAQVDLKKTAKVIGQDPALSAKVLEYVNSPFFGLRKEVTTLSHAVALLGFHSIRTLALSFSLVRNLRRKGDDGFDYTNYWRRSIIAAAAARSLGVHLKMVNQEELFLAGLLQDIGMLVLQEVDSDYGQVVVEGGRDHLKLQAIEKRVLEADHAQVSAWMAEIWSLPELYQLALKGSHDPEAADCGKDEETRLTVECVHLSGWLADLWLSEDAGGAYASAQAIAQKRLQMSEEKLREVLSATGEALPDLSKLFEIEVGDSESLNRILDDAREQLISLTLQSVREVDTLSLENDSLREKSLRDSLTGVYNRSYLDQALENEFLKAHRLGKPLSVIYCDIDHFKTINDTYGHQVGDQALVTFARAITNHVRDRDVVARYGGDEFVIILPGTPDGGADVVAERIRSEISGNPLQADGHSVQLTTSLGIATHCAEHPFESAEALCAAADSALYAAKRAGRNKVGRTASPRTLSDSPFPAPPQPSA